MRRLFSVLAFILIVPGTARAYAPLWTVHGPKGEVVLFGSFHLLAPGLDWRPPALEAALKRADEICFEISDDEAHRPSVAAFLDRASRLRRGRRLADQLSPALHERLDRDARALGVDPALLEDLKPWAVDLLLTEAVARQVGARADTGVERDLQTLARPEARRCALETAEGQIAVLAGLDKDEDAAQLRLGLDDVEKGPALLTRMMDAYARGDLEIMKAWAVDELKTDSPRAYRKLFVSRNLGFARAVEARLREPGVTVIVVGEGHMLGPDGVPALLRRRGYVVDGPAI